MRDELVDRLSSMLNFNLHQLCGPKCNDLKVRNPAKYGWDPRRLLGQIFDIYLHLDCDRFAQALASDERSFQKHLFDDAASRIERLRIRSAIEVEKFRALINKAHDIYGKLTVSKAFLKVKQRYMCVCVCFSGKSTSGR